MIRNLKALGLALVAALAMSAVPASTASATDFFTSAVEKTWLTGTSQNSVLSILNRKYECTTSSFTGTFTNGDDTMTVLPSLTGTKNVVPHTNHCSAVFGSSATFDFNHCAFILTGDTTQNDGGTDAAFWIECPGFNQIQTTSSASFTIQIPAQTSTAQGGVTYTNLANHSGGSAIRVTATMTGITTTCMPSFQCTLAGVPHHSNNSSYTGTFDLTGYEDKGGTFTAPTEGNRVPIAVS